MRTTTSVKEGAFFRGLSSAALFSALTVGAAGCAASPVEHGDDTGGDESSAPLAVEVTFAAVVEQRYSECPADDPTAFGMSGSNDGGPAQCVMIDSADQFSTSAGEVRLVQPSSDERAAESIVELTLEQSDAESLHELTSSIVDRSQPDNLLAIIVENEVESVPAVMTPIAEGALNISAGDDTESFYTRLTGEPTA